MSAWRRSMSSTKKNAGTSRRRAAGANARLPLPAALAAAAPRRPPITERRRSGAVLIRHVIGSCRRANIHRRLSASTFREAHKTHDCPATARSNTQHCNTM